MDYQKLGLRQSVSLRAHRGLPLTLNIPTSNTAARLLPPRRLPVSSATSFSSRQATSVKATIKILRERLRFLILIRRFSQMPEPILRKPENPVSFLSDVIVSDERKAIMSKWIRSHQEE